MFLALFLGIINLIKLGLIRYLPLLGDEAYYNIWSKHPALSYTDHPPMIAYIHGLLNALLGQTEFAVRFGAIVLVLISTYLIYLVGKEAFGKKIGVASAVLFNIIPTYFAGGLFLTPEQPLIIFWLLATYACVKIIKTQQSNYWYLLGLAGGLGLLSKYPMILFVPGLFLFLGLSKENRHWLQKKEPYLAGLLAFFICSPVLIWNIQHSFPALLHHGARIGNPNYLNNILNFLLLQFVMFSPPLFIFSVSTFFYGFWRRQNLMDNQSLLLICLSLASFLPFLFISPFTIIGGHWTSIVYLGMLVVLCQRWFTMMPNPLRNFRFWANILIIVLINILFVGYYAFLYPIPQEYKGKAYSINYELPDFIKSSKVDHVYSNQMGVASLVAFYGKTEVYLPKGIWKQYDIWSRPELKPGDDILYFVFDEKAKKNELTLLFKTVKEDKTKRFFTKDSNIPLKTQIFICRGLIGNRISR